MYSVNTVTRYSVYVQLQRIQAVLLQCGVQQWPRSLSKYSDYTHSDTARIDMLNAQ
jgi:hypothetical protein